VPSAPPDHHLNEDFLPKEKAPEDNLKNFNSGIQTVNETSVQQLQES